MKCYTALYSLALLLLITPMARAVQPAADPAATPPGVTPPVAQPLSQEELFKAFEESLSGAKFTGKFTIVAMPEKGLVTETYEIKSVQKLEQGDYWLFKARVKYGDHDIVVPMPLEVKWAGETPVITLTNTTIPGLGTFSARVLIHNDWYAGTWVHGEKGGHLFGTIEKNKAEPGDVEAIPPAATE